MSENSFQKEITKKITTDEYDSSSQFSYEKYLAAIIAHELSNPFTALVGRVELIKNRKDLPSYLLRDLDAMKSANDRIEKILSNLKIFSRLDIKPPKLVSLYETFEKSWNEIIEKWENSKIELTHSINESIGTIIANKVLLKDVIVSTTNSILGRSSEISICRITALRNNVDEEVIITIKDDGPEITESEILPIFHPFGQYSPNALQFTMPLAYNYYVIRPWGGSIRFQKEDNAMVTNLCFSLS